MRLIEELADSLQLWGALGPSLFVVLFVLMTLLFFPASPLAIAAGFLYGPLTGTLATSFAGLISAVLAFLISRYLARNHIHIWLARFPRAAAIDTAVSSDGFRVVFLLRLASILPFIPVSYLMGVARIRVGTYVLATWSGLLPGTFLYVFVGSLVSGISQLSEGGKILSPFTGMLTVAGGIVVAITLAIITRRARSVLNQVITR
ncbi:VTT domain-containing protein [Pectobacterium carotovorum]|uniref:TVP38/TMEM64 family protein n=1 Tax=Pectobacterium carotovorum TaxID=554 RepID=UPI00301894F4